jgi:hypothetical protein
MSLGSEHVIVQVPPPRTFPGDVYYLLNAGLPRSPVGGEGAMDITRSIPCEFCGNKAAGVWGRHLYCWDCFQKKEPPDTSVEEFAQRLDDLLAD